MTFSSSSLKILHRLLIIYAIVLIACLSVEGQDVDSNDTTILGIKRSDLPSDFLFGVSTAAVQIEGSAKEGGRGPSIWDDFVVKFPVPYRISSVWMDEWFISDNKELFFLGCADVDSVSLGHRSNTICNTADVGQTETDQTIRSGALHYSLWQSLPTAHDFLLHSGKINGGGHEDMLAGTDSYKRYKEDVMLLKDLGVDSNRLSISWTRILPTGSLSGGVNQEGINHYNSLINELIANGIKPFVTIFHFDSPQALQEKYGGFLNRTIVDDFRDYSEICFNTFGDRVKNWITINEPYIIAQFGYDFGAAAPGRCSIPLGACPAGNSSTEPYIASHNLILAHATAVKLYRDKFQAKQGGEIGISLVGQYMEPYSNQPVDINAAKRAQDFNLGWYMEPLVYGDYPRSMRDLVKERLPTFTEEEKILVKGAFDFIGINYYTSRYAKGLLGVPPPPLHYAIDSLVNVTVEKDGVLIGPLAQGSSFIYVYPVGIMKLLDFMKQEYQSPKIYITENGITELRNDSIGLNQALYDPHRINNTLRHLYWINKAIENGVNVKGYFHWTLMDDFEYENGYTLRYGLYYIDYKNNFTRIPKLSSKWYKGFIKGDKTQV